MLGTTLWIGGPPCAGKTSVARRLARRHGLRLYSADTKTWEHRDRALAAGHPAALRWEALSHRERWETATVADLFAMSLHHERGWMVVDDLRRLPAAPLVLAEGGPLPPWALSRGLVPPARALWLIPTERFQADRLAELETTAGQRSLYRFLRDVIEQEAADAKVPTLSVDGSSDLDAVARTVEHHFAASLATGPVAHRPEQRARLLREMNLALVGQVRGYHARAWAAGDAEVVTIDAVCECGDRSCQQMVRRQVGEVAAAAVLGHL